MSETENKDIIKAESENSSEYNSEYVDEITNYISKLEKDSSDNDDETSDDETDDEYDDSVDDNSTMSTTKYARDALFGNVVYKNKLFENKFSNILKFLEFTTENRGISQPHVNTIFEHYLENPDEFIKPLDIMCYFEDGMDSDHFYIADGQHRFMALKKLFEEKGIDKELLYFIHDVKNQDDIRRTIKYLNSSNPVQSIYSFEKIPDFIKKISDKYTNIFSDNLKHSDNKMHQIKLRDHIEEIKLFKDSDFGVDDAFNYLLEFNKKVKDDFLKRENKPASDKKLFDKVAETHQFYALIYKNYTWLNEFYLFVQEKMYII
jgi:hypothetical protein